MNPDNYILEKLLNFVLKYLNTYDIENPVSPQTPEQIINHIISCPDEEKKYFIYKTTENQYNKLGKLP